MDRRRYLKATGAAVAGSAFAGCSGGDIGGPTDGDDGSEGGSEAGTLSTSVTDQPVDIQDFESCVVTIDGIWVKPGDSENQDAEGDESVEDPESEGSDGRASEGGEGDGEGDENDGSEADDEPDDAPADEGEGRRYIEFDEPQEADLAQLQGENTQLIDETELAVGEYRFLQLDVSDVEGTLVGGGDAEVDTPGNAPLQFQQTFEIRADVRTRFIADFAPVRRGQGDRYLLRPVARGTQVLYGDEGYDPETENDASDGPGNESDAGEDGSADETGD